MPIRLTSLRRHRWLASLAVLAFALRALIPAGFMPGGDGPLTLQICPDGFPAALLTVAGDPSTHAAHHHHHGSSSAQADLAPGGTPPDAPVHDHQSWTSGHCVFSAVAGAPPLSHSSAAAVVAETTAPRLQTGNALIAADLRFRIAQPRAPPAIA